MDSSSHPDKSAAAGASAPSVRSASSKATSGMASLFSCFGPRKPQLGASNNDHQSPLNEKAGGGIGSSNARTRAWEAQLPQPVDTHTIQAKVAAVFADIDAYVEKFYRDKTSLELDATHEACLMLVGTPHLPSSLIDLVQSNRPNPLVCRPTALIKHCIAYLIQQAMTMDEGGRNSLLPPWATALPQALRGQDHADKTAFDEAFTHWRVLTSYLQPALSSPAAKASRTQAVRAIADRIGGAFAPWEAMPGAPEQRAELVAICDKATDAAAVLFAQPARFVWSWEPVDLGEEEEPRKVCVVKPGLRRRRSSGSSSSNGAGEEEEEEVVRAVHIPLTFPVGHVAA